MTPGSNLAPENTTGSVLEYIALCRRHLSVIIGVTVALTTAVALWSLMQTPIYQAKAAVVIEREGPSMLIAEQNYATDTSPEYVQTHFELLKSHQVLKEAAQVLHLAERPEYRVHRSWLTSVLAALVTGTGARAASLEDSEQLLLKEFRDRVEVKPVRGTRLAHVLVLSEDPRFAAEAANTLASVYIDRTLELKAKIKERAAQWFASHLDELRKRVEESEEALYAYRAKYGLIDMNERQTISAQKLAELNSELVKAEIKRSEASARLQQIASVRQTGSTRDSIDWARLIASAEVLNSTLIQTLTGQEVKVSGHLAELSEKYGPRHPKIAHAVSELKDLREQIRREIEKIYYSVKHEYQVALERERLIKAAVAKQEEEKVLLEQHSVQYELLNREANSNRQLYDTFLKQMKEADLSAEMKASNIYLADPAVPATAPLRPKTVFNTILALLVGAMAGVGLAFAREYCDSSLKGPEDLERHLPTLPILGMVPLVGKETQPVELVLVQHPTSSIADSVRSIRTSVLLSSAERRPASVLVTSACEGEGKTTLAVNLAIAMAQLGQGPVILIDADLRRPRLHDMFRSSNGNGKKSGKGLVHFLAGEAEPEEIVHPSHVPNLFVIFHGAIPPNPSELLHSSRMQKLMEFCRAQAYQVIFDAPPVMPVTDPVILADQVDGVVLVTSAGQTSRDACRLTVQRITRSGRARLLGAVVQKVRLEEMPSFYGYYGKDAQHKQGRHETLVKA
ncbi:GumC family protein [Candidatus Nitrospira bockiana]